MGVPLCAVEQATSGTDEVARMRVGILALQGAFEEHEASFRRLDVVRKHNIEILQVRTCEQLDSCDALVIPGGESTTMKIIAGMDNFMDRLRKFVRSEKPVWGTCAGLILLSDDVVNALAPTTPGGDVPEPVAKRCKYGDQMGGLNLQTCRNYFGSQRRSFEAAVQVDSKANTLAREAFADYPAVFIRAPGILKVGEGVRPLASVSCHHADDVEAVAAGGTAKRDASVVVAAESDRFLVTCFHPELTSDDRVHKYFIDRFVVPAAVAAATAKKST